jgi:hypothetical protein
MAQGTRVYDRHQEDSERASEHSLPPCYQCGSRFLRVHLPPVRLESGREVKWSTRLYRCANPRCEVTMTDGPLDR